MKKQIELLAPGGDLDSIKAAILAGADAVYCGLAQFNARNRATNLSFDDLNAVVRLAHKNLCKVFVTLNILIYEKEIPSITKLLNKLVNTQIDGVIVQDLGLLYILTKYFKTLKIHVSTQMTTHNEGQIKFLSNTRAERVNLSRELNLNEIRHLTQIANQHKIQTEVFIHGSQCICFSGLCYMSSVHGGNSGNRGKCSQPCRDPYKKTKMGKTYPLNLKDNAAYNHIDQLVNAGVYSLKIEGRIKKYDYIFKVVDTYRKQIDAITENQQPLGDDEELYKVFNRSFSNAYLSGSISKGMFIDNPRDYSIVRLTELKKHTTDKEIKCAEETLLNEKERFKKATKAKVDELNTSKTPVNIALSGKVGSPLLVAVSTPEVSFKTTSQIPLNGTGTEALNYKMAYKKLKAINNNDLTLETIDLKNVDGKVFLPYKELTAIKNKISATLSPHKAIVAPAKLKLLSLQQPSSGQAEQFMVINSLDEIECANTCKSQTFVKLPSNFSNRIKEYVNVFSKNKKLIPWFPSILIGDDYQNALDFINKVKPTLLITDNSGIGYEALEKGIDWIAGPYLNSANSYALLALKETYNSVGAFLSNELSVSDLKKIKRPEGFKLFYQIKHKATLMVTRQCLYQQLDRCDKKIFDIHCVLNCEKSSTLKNDKGISFNVAKEKGSYFHIYDSKPDHHKQNTDEILSWVDAYTIEG